MKLHKLIIKRRLFVVLVWAVILLASTPAIMGYSHFISYSNSTSTNNAAESQIAGNILTNASKDNSTLLLVVTSDPYSNTTMASKTIQFQNAVMNTSIVNLSGTDSPYTAYESFLNSVLTNQSSSVTSSYYSLRNASFSLYQFPAAFLSNWSSLGYNSSQVYNAAYTSGYNSSNPYESAFVETVNSTVNSSYPSNFIVTNATEIVNESIGLNYILVGGNLYFVGVAHQYLGVLNYSTELKSALSNYLTDLTGYNLTVEMISSILMGGNIGQNYVLNYGLTGIPEFISDRYISPDHSSFLINVLFSVPSGFVGAGGFQPASAATPAIQNISKQYFGSSALLTGNGAIAFETQQITAQYGFVFALLFIVLAVAVAITLVSWKSSIVALIFVSLATALGYVAIYITGLIVHNVSYIVNYTLTAVAVGVSTDYLVFIASRYRQDIREGKSPEESLENATGKAGKAVIISGLTVGFSLATFSFIPGFESWGLVLLFSILMIVALETTLFPAILSYFGPGFYTKKGRSPVAEDYFRKSVFYRAARISMKRKWAVAGIVVLLGIPAGYYFFTVPTTYDFNTGLPQNLQSVQALNLVEQKFGSNVLYPATVIVELNSTNGALSSGGMNLLNSTTKMLLGYNGVTKVIGPYSNGTSYNFSLGASQYVLQDGKYAYYLVYTSYDPYSQSAINIVQGLRSNSTLIVGGITSSVIDQQHENYVHYSELEALIIGVIFIILLVSFWSPKYPIISISGVFISISWTTFILYVISKFFLLEGLIYLIPIILFIILMSLGNDYTVFIISRVKEYSGELGFEEGLPRAMASSGRVVTSLGMILALSLGSLGLIRSGFLQQLGIAFFISLLIDTFIIRTFYFPAMLTLMTRLKNRRKAESN